MPRNAPNRVARLFPALLLLGLIPLTSWAADHEVRLASILREINRTQHEIRDVTAEVTQIRTGPLMTTPLVSKGTMYFKRPDRIRLDMLPPNPSVTVLSEGVLWIYFPDDKVAQRYHVQDNPNLTKWLLVFQDPIATLGQRVTLGRETGTTATLILDPAEDLVIFQNITLSFDTSRWMLQSLELQEKNGDHTIINYQYTSINGGIPDTRFALRLPPDVDVIDPLQK